MFSLLHEPGLVKAAAGIHATAKDVSGLNERSGPKVAPRDVQLLPAVARLPVK
jgi:uncharacterized protein YraI